MIIICLMGRSASGKSMAESALEKVGFTRSISYTTKQPQIRDGKQEENGKDYRFTTRKKFMELVESGKIIEYEEYNGNLYGTPRPFGAKRFVAVVCVGGYKALKEIYGDQVIGIYLKVDESIAEQRAKTEERFKLRKAQDDKLIKEIEEVADFTIDANQDRNKMIYDILKAIRSKEEQ